MTESVLFVRCVPQPLARSALQALRLARPAARIDVLSNTAAGAALTAAGVADTLVEYPGASYRVFGAGLRVLPGLRRRRYDVVVVPYTARGREAFWNVARLALLAGARQTVWQRVEPEQTDPPDWTPVRLREWWAGRSPGARLREVLLALVTPPALIVAWAIAVAALAALALVLIPAVWLKPDPPRGRA
jgi:hypothetical protein